MSPIMSPDSQPHCKQQRVKAHEGSQRRVIPRGLIFGLGDFFVWLVLFLTKALHPMSCFNHGITINHIQICPPTANPKSSQMIHYF